MRSFMSMNRTKKATAATTPEQKIANTSSANGTKPGCQVRSAGARSTTRDPLLKIQSKRAASSAVPKDPQRHQGSRSRTQRNVVASSLPISSRLVGIGPTGPAGSSRKIPRLGPRGGGGAGPPARGPAGGSSGRIAPDSRISLRTSPSRVTSPSRGRGRPQLEQKRLPARFLCPQAQSHPICPTMRIFLSSVLADQHEQVELLCLTASR